MVDLNKDLVKEYLREAMLDLMGGGSKESGSSGFGMLANISAEEVDRVYIQYNEKTDRPWYRLKKDEATGRYETIGVAYEIYRGTIVRVNSREQHNKDYNATSRKLELVMKDDQGNICEFSMTFSNPRGEVNVASKSILTAIEAMQPGQVLTFEPRRGDGATGEKVTLFNKWIDGVFFSVPFKERTDWLEVLDREVERWGGAHKKYEDPEAVPQKSVAKESVKIAQKNEPSPIDVTPWTELTHLNASSGDDVNKNRVAIRSFLSDVYGVDSPVKIAQERQASALAAAKAHLLSSCSKNEDGLGEW